MKTKKIASLLFTVILALTTFANSACGNDVKDSAVDLEIYCTDAGYKTEWVSDIIDLFKQQAWVKEKYPDAVLIMLLPPSYKTQEERLRGRGTETEEKILARLEQTKNEVVKACDYDYIVYNRDGESVKCAEDILAIVRAEHLASARNPKAAVNYFAN